MTIPNQPTVFRKKEVLKAAKLNQALGEYGSKGGIIPYDENGQGDTSHELPLGTKQNTIGNAFFKGINIYTQLEVQQLVEAGKLTQTDRFVFWNLTTESLCAWNGTEIVTLQGSDTSMEYLFGDGSDGDVTMVANGSYDRMKNFTNFTLNAGVTLTKTTAGSPLIIRCTGVCTINGTINLKGKGMSGGAAGANGYGYGNSASGENTLGGVGLTNRSPSGSIDLNAVELAAAALNFEQIPFCGGGGAGAAITVNSSLYSGSDSKYGGIGAGCGGIGKASAAVGSSSSTITASCTGGNGGGGLLIIARKIVIAGSVVATGTNGSSQNQGSGSGVLNYYLRASGGGGGGGCGVFVGNEISITGTMNFAGGASGGNQSGTEGGAGGSGGYIKLIV